jgi:DNA-binding transcriptional regulator YiaG
VIKEIFMATAKTTEKEYWDLEDSGVCETPEAVSAEEIVALRKKLCVSQTDMAKRLGISVRVLQSWEQGARNPSAPARALLRGFWQRRVLT